MEDEPSPQHRFTCMACQVAFSTPDEQRSHHQTDWHRYNLKRKVASLPPVSADSFANRVLAQQSKTEAEKHAKMNPDKPSCAMCRKVFNSKNAYKNHLASKKHREAEAAEAIKKRNDTQNAENNGVNDKKDHAEKPVPIKVRLAQARSEEEIQTILREKIENAPRLNPDTDCLFCSHNSESLEENLKHMTHVHSFYIPDVEFLVDVRGLIGYLGEKISVKNICLYCNGKGKSFHDMESLRKHMMDKGHMKILYDDGADLEIADYYDFSSTWQDAEDDASWCDVDEEIVDEDEAVSEEEDLEQTLMTCRKVPTISADDSELILPSGARLGHRIYERYYKQRLRPETALVRRLASDYRVMGWEQTEAFRAIQRQEHREERRAHRVQAREQLHVGMRANGLQKHFRVQIDF